MQGKYSCHSHLNFTGDGTIYIIVHWMKPLVQRLILRIGYSQGALG